MFRLGSVVAGQRTGFDIFVFNGLGGDVSGVIIGLRTILRILRLFNIEKPNVQFIPYALDPKPPPLNVIFSPPFRYENVPRSTFLSSSISVSVPTKQLEVGASHGLSADSLTLLLATSSLKLSLIPVSPQLSLFSMEAQMKQAGVSVCEKAQNAV
ncbi:hypothetical protein JOM56_012686 [Amanita muscaria]